jgi:hypothetical protein
MFRCRLKRTVAEVVRPALVGRPALIAHPSDDRRTDSRCLQWVHCAFNRTMIVIKTT